MKIRIRWFHFGHFNRSDSQRPNICQTIISNFLNDLWRHPELKNHNYHQKLKLIHTGVPIRVSLFDCVSVSCPATPKSANFERPSFVNRIFPHLTSRWIFLCVWRYSRPFKVSDKTTEIDSSFKVCFLERKMSEIEPPPQNSMTIHKL